MIRTLHEGFLADGIAVPLTKLCAWFGVPRRTVYYKPTMAAPKVAPHFADPIKAMIEKEPSFGYRTVAWLLGFNKNTVQQIFQIRGWHRRMQAIFEGGFRHQPFHFTASSAVKDASWLQSFGMS